MLIAVVLFTLLATAYGQVESKGRFISNLSKTFVSDLAIHRLPPQDNQKLSKSADLEAGPYKFAQAFEYALDIKTHGEWKEDVTGGVRIWQVQVQSPGALQLSLLFSEFQLPEGSELYVIGKKRTHGAYTAGENNMDDGKFAVGLVQGDTAILEYIEPLNTPVGSLKIKLHKIVHGFRSVNSGTSGSCNIDVACADGKAWKNQINSVGMMLTNDAQRFCSGAMVNNVRQDGTQYFLTANHCIFADVSYFMIGFNYQWPYCKSGNASGVASEPTVQLVHGLRVVSKWDKSDFALLLVKERIPDAMNVFLAGWDQRNIAATNIVGIHHPSGDVKKISTFIGQLQPASWTEFPLKYHWEVPKWTRGITEPGSSGSPIFNSRGLLVGHLHGGQSACTVLDGYDMYGGVAFDWSSALLSSQRLAPYLNPTKVNVTSLGGVSLKSARERILKVQRIANSPTAKQTK